MNRKILTLLTSLALIAGALLSGCSSATGTASASSGLTTASKLALGTLKLEGSSNAVTADEAKQLLTLWQGYQSLTSSDTTAQVELDALVKQIQSSMSAAQTSAIQAMDLTDQSLNETLSSMASSAPASTPGVSSASSSASSASGMLSGGSNGMPSGAPSGAPPSGSGEMPAGGDSSGVSDVLNGTASQGTASATQTPAQSGTAHVNPILLQAVIQLLETRSQAAG